MFFLKQQNGSALIVIMLLVCIIAVLYFYVSDNGKDVSSPLKTIDIYKNATDDLDAVRGTLEKQNTLIMDEVTGSSTVE